MQVVPVPDDAVVGLLRAWVGTQRWFGGKDAADPLVRLGVAELAGGPEPVQIHLLATETITVQVPTVIRSADDDAAVIGVADGRVVCDGAGDPAFLRAWFAAAEHREEVALDLTGMRVVGGEQSNTSVVLPGTDPPTILKVFRSVTAGPNPDVEVPLALAEAGWDGVPRPLAWLTATWQSADLERTGHLGVLSEFIPGAQDGFQLACTYAGRGDDFTDLAADLGRTTAQMHRALRVALPVEAHLPRVPAARAAAVHDVARNLRERAEAAQAAVGALAERRTAILDVIGDVEALDAVPPTQRVHGDLHLGQVLRGGDRWYVLDFEGEPQAPLAERSRPDLALRDVAGMLRSFDYAAAVGGGSRGWAELVRLAYVSSYQEEADQGSHGLGSEELLRALELDKALYEVVYESRHRPDWVQIPLEGVDRLLRAAG